MTTLREAAQQALEALEGWKDDAPSQWSTNDEKRITTLRAALEQPEQVKVPQFRKVNCADWYDGYADHEDGHGPYEQRVLYTHPPRREWESLTDQEVWDAVQQGVVGSIGLPSKAIAVARAIEQALREKNHG